MPSIRFTSWFATVLPKPWLVVGKGPTFARWRDVDADNYHVMALNHAMSQVCCLLGHATDIDVVPDLENEPRFLVMPWHPHVNCRPGKKDLDDHIEESRRLSGMADHGRVLWYNSSLCPAPLNRRGPVVRVRYFSAVAAVNLLGSVGVKDVFTLGIDGGTKYAPAFDKKTLLANGRSSFDVQFGEIRLAEKRYKMKVTPLFKDE